MLVTAAAMLVVWGRMFQLQVLAGDAYRRAADASTRRRESVLGPRGRILDAKGEPLAIERSIVQLVFSPAEWATRERFLEEARAAAKLHHPNVIETHRAGESAGVLYMAMQYVNGRTLEKLLKHDGRMPYMRLAESVGLSEAAVRQRVQRLIETNVMQIVAVTDPLRLGFRRQAMIGIRTEGDITAVASALSAISEVDYVRETTSVAIRYAGGGRRPSSDLFALEEDGLVG